MRLRAAVLIPSILVVATAAVAQRRTPARPRDHRTATPSTSAAAAPSLSTSTDAGALPTRSADPHAAPGSDGGLSTSTTDAATPNTFNIPMRQVGTGAVTHYPIPEQLARTDVPVFVQVRSTAPIDHVSLFYRGQGAVRFRELRMTPMGHNLALPGGYGAQIPCDDAFPPAVEYYVQAIDTSGTPVGSAGSATAPVSVPIVTARTHPIIPTLPGQPPPRTCGSLVTPVATTSSGGSGGTTRARDAGPPQEMRGTADLGEPCTRDLDCISSRLRCGSNHRCVLIDTP